MIESEKRIDGKGIFPAEGKRLALTVGVNASIKSIYRDPLKYAERDAYEMAIALESSTCNFTLLKPALQGKEATTRDVKNAVIELITESTPQDFLCFYFSGHAQPMKVKGESQDIYLVTHDFNESQVEIDPTHHLSMRWLWEVLYQRTNVGKILVILDCCYAGNMLAAGPDQYQIDLYKLFKNYFEEDTRKQTDRSRFILSATGHDAVAHERDGHGIMTGLLLKALRGEVTNAYDEEGYLDISALYTYLLKTMPEQPPSRSNEGRDRFILAWFPPQSQSLHDEARKSPSLIMTEADFWKRFEETSHKLQTLPFDHTLCTDTSLADIDEEAVISLFKKERVQKQPGFHSNMTNQEVLEHFNLLQETFLTYGAILCIGKNPSKWIVGAFTRCTRWKGNDRLEGWKEDQYFRGSLLQQYELSIEFLQSNLRLGRVISAKGSTEEWEIPFGALREALANALIHREYSNQTNYVRVELFDNRIEISNPGGLPNSITIAQLGSENYYRNPQIARIFYLCNYVEEAGTGIARMQQLMKGAGLPRPQFETNNGRTFKVTLRRPQQAILREATVSSFSSIRKAVDSKRGHQLISVVLATILVMTFLPSAFSWLFATISTILTTPNTVGIGIINEPNNEQIGLSDGTYTFDTGTDRADASLKKEAATKLAQGDVVGATSLWNQAAGIDTSDAEALIYLEDQHVLASGSPYITLVVATTLTGSPNDISSGRVDLQGAYVAQKEYNDGLKLGGGRQIRLLIANAGSKKAYVPEVAGQIVQAAKQDTTIVGVMGWHLSSYAQIAIPLLTRAHIPMVSSTASADRLSGMSPYFFRVGATNKREAIAGVRYAEQQLHASRVALFVDPKDAYSSNLADDFEQQFVADGHQIVDTENYTVGDKSNLPALLQNALKSNPDLIYFAGYADDLSVLLINLGTSYPNLQILGGDGLYNPNAYSSTARLGLNRVRFTAFAYPDEWSMLGLNEPQFFSEYPADFNPTNADHSANPYGFTRADFGVILGYDATFALLQGCQNVLGAGKALTAVNLRGGLAQITGKNAIQGVSGQISFDRYGDPIDKAVVILYGDPDGHIQLFQPNGVQGCFVLGTCG